MKKIGIVGGLGWRSTAAYYAALCERSEGRMEVTIESLDLDRALAMLGRIENDASWECFDRYHRDALQRLQRSGAEIACIASNTPHHRLRAITDGLELPVVDIVDAVAELCARHGVQRLLVLGTSLTMTSPEIAARYARHGISPTAPDRTDWAQLESLIERLQARPAEARAAAETIEAIAARAGYTHAPDTAVALACTELPLAFPDRLAEPIFAGGAVRFINTLAAHVDAVYAAALAP